jgi:hypothetical protein
MTTIDTATLRDWQIDPWRGFHSGIESFRTEMQTFLRQPGISRIFRISRILVPESVLARPATRKKQLRDNR